MRSLSYRVARSVVAILAVLVTLGMTTPPASAQTTSTSDLSIKIISGPPSHVRACQTFKVVYKVTNHGPDLATNVNIWSNTPDPVDRMKISKNSFTLAKGKSKTVTATYKVVAYVPGESSTGWVTAGVVSDVYPNISIDPNPANDQVTRTLKYVGKQVTSCP
jgi:hypothetical protein